LKKIWLLFLLMSFAGFLISQEVRPENTQNVIPALPLTVPDTVFKPLQECNDEYLVTSLRNEVNKNSRWKRLVANKQMSIGVVDLTNETQPRFAGINGNEMMYAASLPKIAILLAAVDAIDQGELKQSEEVKRDMRSMISKSDNQASTRMIDRLGYEKIEAVLTNEKYHLYDPDKGGGLWVGKRYASGGPTNREPLKNLSHAANAFQVCRFYYMLINGRLVSYERSSQMLGILESPELHHKFVSTLDEIAPVARKFRKSGSWKSYHSDSILVWGKDRRYILVALVNDENGEQIMRNLVIPVERAINKK
jgi:beta-lactamase class A